MEECEAIAQLQGGNIAGLETLVHRYQAQAVGAAYLISRDAALAEDIVQAAFLRVYERIAQFDPARPFGPWFLRSVVNDTLKAVARRARQVPFPVDDASDLAPWPDPGPGPADLAAAAETRTAIGVALERLSPDQRAAIVLRYYLGLSEAEMALRLAVPLSTVKWRLHAARRRLHDLLPAWLRPAAPDEA